MSNGAIIFQCAFFSTVFVGFGLFDLEYWYYMLLRIGICGSAILLALMLRRARHPIAIATLAGVALLYNPLLPVRLGDKSVWIAINLATVAFFWFLLFLPDRSEETALSKSAEWTDESRAEARSKLESMFKLSSARSLPALDGLEIEADCAKCGKRFSLISGTVPLLERENGKPALLCQSCLVDLNSWREQFGLQGFPIPTDGYK